jgi:hypothetical protein
MSEFAAPMPVLARYAVMVDVGYIYAAAGELLFGTSARRDFRVDAVGLISSITKYADESFRGELLRVYWYDAARDRVPTIDQRVVAQMAWVKLGGSKRAWTPTSAPTWRRSPGTAPSPTRC